MCVNVEGLVVMVLLSIGDERRKKLTAAHKMKVNNTL